MRLVFEPAVIQQLVDLVSTTPIPFRVSGVMMQLLTTGKPVADEPPPEPPATIDRIAEPAAEA